MILSPITYLKDSRSRSTSIQLLSCYYTAIWMNENYFIETIVFTDINLRQF